jgi:hypothetical protein
MPGGGEQACVAEGERVARDAGRESSVMCISAPGMVGRTPEVLPTRRRTGLAQHYSRT